MDVSLQRTGQRTGEMENGRGERGPCIRSCAQLSQKVFELIIMTRSHFRFTSCAVTFHFAILSASVDLQQSHGEITALFSQLQCFQSTRPRLPKWHRHPRANCVAMEDSPVAFRLLAEKSTSASHWNFRICNIYPHSHACVPKMLRTFATGVRA